MQLLTFAASLVLLFAVGTQATHKLGSSCSGKDVGTFGCSNDECTVIKCSTSGNGNHYWQFEKSCIGIKCENGACNSAFKKSSCSA